MAWILTCARGIPGAEWDVVPGQQIGVSYTEPDGDVVTNSFVEPAPYLRLWKDIYGSPGAGGNQLFRINYDNNSDGPAENVVITETFSAGFSYMSDTSGFSHTGSGGGPIVWDLGTVQPGERGWFDVFVQVTGSQGDPVSNMADIATSNPYDQGDPSEKRAEWNGSIEANNTQLDLSKQAWTGDPVPGENFVFSVNTCNHGSTGSAEVTLTDDLHPALTLQSWWAARPRLVRGLHRHQPTHCE